MLHEVGPVYPAASVRSHEQGVVALRVLIDEQGRASQVRLLQSSGFPRLDKSAAKAVQRYRFSPPTQGSHPEQYWTTVGIEFDLPPLPVPTTVVGFDSVIAKQIATAKRVDRGGVSGATNLLRQIADDLVDFNSRRPAGEPETHEARSSPTPLQRLTRQGKAKSVDFVGYASGGFDCGTANLPANSGYFRCGIFKIQQVHGTSYWLAAMTYEGTVKSVAVTVAPGLR
jgi:TonB family protein